VIPWAGARSVETGSCFGSLVPGAGIPVPANFCNLCFSLILSRFAFQPTAFVSSGFAAAGYGSICVFARVSSTTFYKSFASES
jgi:hypothetical protein